MTPVISVDTHQGTMLSDDIELVKAEDTNASNSEHSSRFRHTARWIRKLGKRDTSGASTAANSYLGFSNPSYISAADSTNEQDSINSKRTISSDGAKEAASNTSRSITHDSSAFVESQTYSCSFNRVKGVTFALLSTLSSAFNGITVALLCDHIGSNETAFIQMIYILLLTMPFATFFKASFRLSRRAYLILFYRCFIGSICTLLSYFAFKQMSVGTAKALVYTSPVFTALFSCIILREACHFIDVIFSLLTFGGILLVIQPPFIFGEVYTYYSIWGPLACILCAILLGTVYVSLKKIHSHRVHPMTILIVYGIVGMMLSAVATSALEKWINPRCGRDRMLLILNGIFTFLIHVFTTLATLYEKATTVSIIKTTDVFFTFFLEYIFFGLIPNYLTIIGSVVIVICLVAITLRGWRAQKLQMEKDSAKPLELDYSKWITIM